VRTRGLLLGERKSTLHSVVSFKMHIKDPCALQEDPATIAKVVSSMSWSW
jgi:hypothetical protein